MTALAATIGTGNIAGVAAGIVSGGPGALFWIWCYGFVATAVKFSEAVLGVTFRDTRDGVTRTGPMYYLRDGLKSPALAWIYALVAGVAALTTTPFTQTNSIALVMRTIVGVPPWITGIAVAVLTWLVIIGGHQVDRPRRGKADAPQGRPVPGRAACSSSCRSPRISRRCSRSSSARRSRCARSPAAVLGSSSRCGIGLARGMYANEAGYGTAAVAYGTAQSAVRRSRG